MVRNGRINLSLPIKLERFIKGDVMAEETQTRPGSLPPQLLFYFLCKPPFYLRACPRAKMTEFCNDN